MDSFPPFFLYLIHINMCLETKKNTNCIRQAKLIIILFPDIIYN